MMARSIQNSRRHGVSPRASFRSSWMLMGVVLAGFGAPASTTRAAGECEDWTRSSDMPTPRLGCRATELNGKIFVAGGYRAANGGGLSELEEYDPATDSWTRRTPMPTGRRRISLSAVNGKVYAIGGNSALNTPALRTVEVYDPLVDEWTPGAAMPTGRFAPATGVVDDKIYVIGGFASGAASAVVEVYDPATDSWSDRTAAPSRRGGQGAGVVDGKIYVVGGTLNPRTSHLRTVEMYDPRADTWQVMSAMPTPRALFPVATVDGRIYAIGGLSTGARAIARVDIFDPRAGTWSEGPDVPGDRFDPAAAALNGRVYAIGGAETASAPHPGLRAVLEYDTRFVASFSLSSDSVSIGEEVVFDGTSTVAPESATIEHRWDFGDGTSAAGAVVSHAYEAPGRFEVRLEVIDGEGICHPARKLLLVAGTSSELGPWKPADVGDPAFPGAARIETDSGVERLRLWAGGERLSGRDDAHFLVTQEIDSDSALTARLDDAVLPVNAQVGLTLRETEAADARHVSLILERSSRDTRLRVRPRLESGGGTAGAGEVVNTSAPIWLRLERSGDAVRAFWSPDHPDAPDGAGFRPLATVELPGLAPSVLLGFAGMGAEPDSETTPFVLLDALWSEIDLEGTGLAPRFLRGDCNDDGSVDIADAVCMLNGLFGGGVTTDCTAALDTNGDAGVDVSDPVSLLNFHFGGGPSPVAPFPGCGPGTVDSDHDLDCATPAVSCQ